MNVDTRHRRLATVLPAIAFVVAFSPRAWSAADAAFATVAPASAPATARVRENPYAHDKDAVDAGKKLFLRHCATCHGETAAGTRRAPGLVSDAVRPMPPGEIEWLLRNGVMQRGMPSWSGLPEQRRWQIVAFLQTLPKTPGAF